MQINDLNASYVKDFSDKKSRKPEEGVRKQLKELQEYGAKNISEGYFMQFQMQTVNLSNGNFSFQSLTFEMSVSSGDFLNHIQNPANKVKNALFGVDLSKIGYSGKPIDTLTQDEAKALVSEDGFFGISQTSERIADFVIMGAGNDLEKLKSGKEGMLRGFKEAEQMWGEKLPDIAYETMKKSLAKVNDKISALGGNTLDVQA